MHGWYRQCQCSIWYSWCVYMACNCRISRRWRWWQRVVVRVTSLLDSLSDYRSRNSDDDRVAAGSRCDSLVTLRESYPPGSSLSVPLNPSLPAPRASLGSCTVCDPNSVMLRVLHRTRPLMLRCHRRQTYVTLRPLISLRTAPRDVCRLYYQ